ncbi:MAG: RNA-binding protein [Caldithrix sp.]|nr:RNA-binding protein [Caldithrix sp.]
MNLYVGNLSKDVSDDDLRQAFEVYGPVKSATVIKDRYSGESRGFGFVEMDKKAEGVEAISGLNGQDVKGRGLVVSEARPKKKNNNRRGGGPGGRQRRRY